MNRHLNSTYVISDLHMGDGSARDNFAVGDKASQLLEFIDHTETESADLVILGDLFEFWQASLGRVLVKRKALLDRLAEIGAVYVVGNHDIDLEALIGTNFLAHPFFENMAGAFAETIGSRTFYFMHGHEVDEFNKGDKPGKGRALTILAGLAEDAVGSPFLDEEQTQSVEQALVSLGERALGVWNWLVRWFTKVGKKTAISSQTPTPRQKPSLLGKHLADISKFRQEHDHDALVVGHTHKLGTYEDWYFNSGGWAEKTNDVLKIDSEGNVTFHEFREGKLFDKKSVPRLEEEVRIGSVRAVPDSGDA